MASVSPGFNEAFMASQGMVLAMNGSMGVKNPQREQ